MSDKQNKGLDDIFAKIDNIGDDTVKNDKSASGSNRNTPEDEAYAELLGEVGYSAAVSKTLQTNSGKTVVISEVNSDEGELIAKKKSKNKLSKKARARKKKKLTITLCILIPLLIVGSVFALGYFVGFTTLDVGGIKNAQPIVNAPIPSYMPKGTQKTKVYYATDETGSIKYNMFEVFHPLTKQYATKIETRVTSKGAEYFLTISQHMTSYPPIHLATRETLDDGSLYSYEIGADGVVKVFFSVITDCIVKEATKPAAPEEGDESTETPALPEVEEKLTEEFRFIYYFEITGGDSNETKLEEAKKVIKSVIDVIKAKQTTAA